MALTQARALFEAGGVRIEAHDPERDRAALRSLAVWAHRFSPAVAVDDAHEEPDGLMLDVSGCGAVFGGEACLIETVLDRLRGLGFRARAAIAPTFGCAWGVARFGPSRMSVIEPGRVRSTLAPLPVGALRVGDGVVAELGALGIDRVGHLLDLPRSALPARFGHELLLRLDQALGQAIETVEAVRPTTPPEAGRVFDGPTDRVEAIELSVRALLEEVAGLLRTRECGARSVEVELVRSDLPAERLAIVLARPSRDAGRLWALVRPKLERAHLGFGVEAIRVRVGSLDRIHHEQQEAWRRGDGPAAGVIERSSAELIDALGNRLGAERVVRAASVESHLPERAFAWHPVARVGARECGGARLTPGDRPTVLFDRPIPAEVVALTPDGPVHRVRWRGRDEGVVACVGPERIAGEWWRGRGSSQEIGTRDCFRVRSEDGRWLWLVRRVDRSGRGAGDWFVHGVWA